MIEISLFYVGCGAQEENLHRRTNLFQCLEDSYSELKGNRTWNYPIPEVNNLTLIFSQDSILFLFIIVWWTLFS